MKGIRKYLTTILLILVFLVGLCLLLYPAASDYWNSLHQSQAIAGYAETVANLDNDTYTTLLDGAKAYNDALASTGIRWSMDEEAISKYEETLDITGTGIMGYVQIEKIACDLPIYHGTDEAVLQVAVGHLEMTSLPVATESYHTVISGHRGLPSARLFTDLDELVEGDEFSIRVLDEEYTYEVDQIRIVLPHEIDSLRIEPGKQYCTLITCTPYGVNTHRLLVRGHQIDTGNTPGNIRVTADATQVRKTLVAPFVAVPLGLLLLLAMMISSARKQARNRALKQIFDDK